MVMSADVSRYWVIAVLALASWADAQPEHVVLVSIDGLAAYELDLRTPMSQTEEYYQALRVLGVPTEP